MHKRAKTVCQQNCPDPRLLWGNAVRCRTWCCIPLGGLYLHTRAFLPNPSLRHSLIYSLRRLAQCVPRGMSDAISTQAPSFLPIFFIVNHLLSIRHGLNQRDLIVGKQKMSHNVCHCFDCQYAIRYRYCCCWWTASYAGLLEGFWF